jgi:hypothetical protein
MRLVRKSQTPGVKAQIEVTVEVIPPIADIIARSPLYHSLYEAFIRSDASNPSMRPVCLAANKVYEKNLKDIESDRNRGTGRGAFGTSACLFTRSPDMLETLALARQPGLLSRFIWHRRTILQFDCVPLHTVV